MVHDIASRLPAAPAGFELVHSDGVRCDRRSVRREIRRREETLRAAGAAPGARVAIEAAPTAECIVTFCALWRIGALVIPLDPRSPEALARNQVAATGATLRISGTSGSATRVEPVAESGLSPAPLGPGTAIFTSGSTGTPRVAVHALAAHFWNALGANRNLSFGPGDRWLLSLPLSHVSGLSILFRAWLGGGAIQVPCEGRPIAETVVRTRPTHLSLVPTQLGRLLRDPDAIASLRHARGVLVGGAPAPPALLARAVDAGLPVLATYGLTEMASQVSTTAPGDAGARLRTAGRPLADRQVRIGSGGEILVRGRPLLTGYLDDGGLRDVRDADGWFHTGDLGRVDRGGRLIVSGRRDNLFLSGGENIQPEEIECELGAIPGVIEAVVVPVPDAEFGARPVAFVWMEGGGCPDEAALRARLAARLPRFKIPDRFLPLPEPESRGGLKAARAALKTRATRARVARRG